MIANMYPVAAINIRTTQPYSTGNAPFQGQDFTACRLPQRLSKVYQIRLPTATLTKSHESTILKTIRGAAGRRFALNKFYGMTAYFVRVGRSFSFALKQSNDADDHQTKRKQRLICNHPASPPPFRDGGRNRLPFATAPFFILPRRCPLYNFLQSTV